MRTISIPSVYGNIEVFEDDLITAEIRRFGGHTRPEFAFALSVLTPDMSVFDLGAHVGTFSLAALAKMRTNRLLALEGNTRTHEVLRRNLGDRGETVCALVGATEGLSFFEKEGNSGGSRLMRAEHGGFEKSDHVTQTMTSIDQLAADHFAPDFIKLDVEGAEYAALSGSRILSDLHPILYVEVSEGGLRGHGHSRRMLSDILTDLGYRFFVNTFEPNGRHDLYRAKQIRNLRWRWEFDALCIHESAEIYEPMRRAASIVRPRDMALGFARDMRRRMRRFRA